MPLFLSLARNAPLVLPSFVQRSAYEAARKTCRQDILNKGICEIPGFIKPEAVARILSAVKNLNEEREKGIKEFSIKSIGNGSNSSSSGSSSDQSKFLGFRSSEQHNVYLENPEEANLNLKIAGNTVSDGSVRKATFESSKVLINQQEISEPLPELVELFEWDGLRELMKKAFGLDELHRSADPIGGVYLNFFEKGDQLGWHFDRSEYSVNLILKEISKEEGCDKEHLPGSFMYFPDSKEFFDENPNFDLKKLDNLSEGESLSDIGDMEVDEGGNKDDNCGDMEVDTVNDTSSSSNGDESNALKLVVPQLTPGTLYLFAGNRSLHCVSENTTDQKRINCIFTFNTKPNVKLNQYTREKFFGPGPIEDAE